MLILASDTSTKSISAAVFEDGRVLASYTKDMGMTHSQTHMPLIDRILKESDKKIGQIDLFAVTVGPGSYTGIRIGVSTTKALAYATGRDVAGVSTLYVLSYPHSDNGTIILPMLDARNRRVFAGGFFNNQTIIAEGNYSVDDFFGKIFEFINSSNRKITKAVICGDAAEKYFADPEIKLLIDKFNEMKDKVSFEFIKTNPDAADLAKIAYEKYLNRTISDKNDFSPFYLKTEYLAPSSAERLKKSDLKG